MKIFFTAFYLLGLFIPAYVFLHDRGGVSNLQALNFQNWLRLIFPLFGLYAFTFVTFQVLIATNLRWLQNIWPKIIYFHRFQGSFALFFAILHPLFILIGYGLVAYTHFYYINPRLRWWLLPAYMALTLLITTVLSALLAWHGARVKWWRKFHRLNYLVLALVWLYSWFVCMDLRISPLLHAA